MIGALDRNLAALGRHVSYTDRAYWAFALVVAAIAVIGVLVTGSWGLAGLVLGVSAILASTARMRYEKSLGG